MECCDKFWDGRCLLAPSRDKFIAALQLYFSNVLWLISFWNSFRLPSLCTVTQTLTGNCIFFCRNLLILEIMNDTAFNVPQHLLVVIFKIKYVKFFVIILKWSTNFFYKCRMLFFYYSTMINILEIRSTPGSPIICTHVLWGTSFTATAHVFRIARAPDNTLFG